MASNPLNNTTRVDQFRIVFRSVNVLRETDHDKENEKRAVCAMNGCLIVTIYLYTCVDKAT